MFNRTCAEGYTPYTGDEEFYCGLERVWKLGTRNAIPLICVFIEQYCPPIQTMDAMTLSLTQEHRLYSQSDLKCLPAYENDQMEIRSQRRTACAHYLGEDYVVSWNNFTFQYDGFWVDTQNMTALPVGEWPGGSQFNCSAIPTFCEAPTDLVFSQMVVGNTYSVLGSKISFACLTGYNPSFGSFDLYCGARKISEGAYMGFWVQQDGIPGTPLACAGSKNACPDPASVVPHSQAFSIVPNARALHSLAFSQCKTGYSLQRQTPTNEIAAHRIQLKCCIVGSFGFWAPSDFDLRGPLPCPTTVAEIPAPSDYQECNLIPDFCPAPAVDPNMVDPSEPTQTVSVC